MNEIELVIKIPKELYNACDGVKNVAGDGSMYDLLIDAIGNGTPLKTGHWINRRIIANTRIDMIVCSECREEFSYDAETGISEYNYCPNCGTKMESEG